VEKHFRNSYELHKIDWHFMKFRYALLFTLLALTLTACNLTLAEDITPPPDYIPPTPMPTMGPLYPAQAPNVADGAAIYAEKCLPCHGEKGLGDGPQGIQLGVTVRAYGLPEIARPASPAQYYTSVTRGNIERFMPPFASLDDQQRWDVVAYVLTLHTTPDQIAKGKQLFEANCPNCSTDFFKNQEKMSALSAVDIARLIRAGNDSFPPFGAKLSDDELWAITDYLRSLSFDNTDLAQATTAPANPTSVAADAGTPSVEGTPVGTEQAASGSEATPIVKAGFGMITGSIVNKVSAGLPSDLAISLHGFDHSTTDPTAGPQEVLTQAGTVNADGTYTFNNIEIPEGRIFLVEADYSGINLKSDYSVVEAGKTTVTVPTLTLYESSQDASKLVIDELHMFIQPSGDTAFEALALYNFRNTSDTMIMVNMGNQQEIPFLKFLTGGEPLGYQAVQDSAPIISTTTGFAMPPNEKAYSILAFSSIPKQKETTIAQEFVLPVAVVSIFVPDGMELKGDNLTADSTQDVSGTLYKSYVTKDIKAGSKLIFKLTGTPKTTDTTSTTTKVSNNTPLLIGAGGLGLILILAGVWLYWRDRQPGQTVDEDEANEEFESSEAVMDAIIALDDLHRAKKISEEVYQKRRGELKEILKGMM
jgi:mono/diheme cytochrome c family protein